MRDDAGPDLLTKEPVQQVFIGRQQALGEDRISKLLELLHDFMVEAGIMVIDAA